jgi:hypothetical protein
MMGLGKSLLPTISQSLSFVDFERADGSFGCRVGRKVVWI